jgi:hypothetical protein
MPDTASIYHTSLQKIGHIFHYIKCLEGWYHAVIYLVEEEDAHSILTRIRYFLEKERGVTQFTGSDSMSLVWRHPDGGGSVNVYWGNHLSHSGYPRYIIIDTAIATWRDGKLPCATHSFQSMHFVSRDDFRGGKNMPALREAIRGIRVKLLLMCIDRIPRELRRLVCECL